MFNFESYIKESPILGILGLGGGFNSFLLGNQKFVVKGGDEVTKVGERTVHTFLTSGILEVKNGSGTLEMEIFVVGGGGGSYFSGGGGSDVTIATRNIPVGDYPMVVGAGGGVYADGSPSTAFQGDGVNQIYVSGGGRGSASYSQAYGPGGPAGRSYYGGPTPASSVTAPGTNYGGYGSYPGSVTDAAYYRSMGGSGAAGLGNYTSGRHGIQYTGDGNSYYYGGGGGGSCYVYTGTGGSGGAGGGGGGGAGPGPAGAGTPGVGDINGRNPGIGGGYAYNTGGPAGANTGGGGGGYGGLGGTGIIIVSYKTP